MDLRLIDLRLCRLLDSLKGDVLVIGSVARGDATADSDLDLWVNIDGFVRGGEDRYSVV